MSPPHESRWLVCCRKDRRGWRTTQYEPYAMLREAQAARLVHLLTEDWDSVDVVEVVGESGEGRRLLAAGTPVRCPCEER